MITDQEMRDLADKATEGPWATAIPGPLSYATHSRNECRCNDSEDYEYRFHRHDQDGGHWHQQIDAHHVYANDEKITIAGNYDYEDGGIIEPHDAAFIAAAREWVPDALTRFAAIRELHQPDWSDWDIDHPEEEANCTCGYNGSYSECPTVRILDRSES
ncbi:hypothetical protein U6G28_02525 [Actinomycetaceae bacterium MB13-C1-2]|nr:hypothetical protein U6G28_02525 [Actinomycetaceae bacterium MB13-C1-2]